MKKYIAGFTLIELSIVLVIIGLIIGGVLVGRDLIVAAGIRSQIKQIEQFKLAANAFKIKYGFLPGDIPPSQTSQLGFFTFTGTNAGKTYLLFFNVAFGYTIYGFGNNDGYINISEGLVFWQHLSQSKMISGEYGGVVGGVNWIEANTVPYNIGGTYFSVPVQLPIFHPEQKKVDYGDYKYIQVYPNRTRTKQNVYSTTKQSNYFEISLKAENGRTIDIKIDDGFASKGEVRGLDYYDNITPCLSGSSSDIYVVAPPDESLQDSCGLDILW